MCFFNALTLDGREYCEDDEICADGGCIKKLSPPGKECEQIGVRENGKYCSLQYELVNQKLEEISCENGFECNSNICVNNSCQSEIPSSEFSSVIWWVMGVVILLFIFGLVIYFLIKNN